MASPVTFTANGTSYTTPARPVAIICLDGSADEYLDAALARDLMPNLERFSVQGFRGMARGALPSFTNVNNTSIVTGVPPKIHGLPGNFFFNPDTRQEVMMNSSSFVRCETILAAAARAGRKVAVVTAKEKLRDIFSAGLIGAPRGIAFSSEKAAEAKRATHGIDDVETLVGDPTPPIYSGEASLYVLRAGTALLNAGLADFLYLSTTDYIQHLYKPEDSEALKFYAGIDEQLGALQAGGAIVGLTADHGMNSKQKSDGSPNVLFLETMLSQKFGPGFRVILPITDPYVVHHGALGSFAVVHLENGQDVAAVRAHLLSLAEITEVWTRQEAAEKLELPHDRIGDLIVLSARDVVLGRTPAYHDLKALKSGLRSHGGRYEEMVPFVISDPLNPKYSQRSLGDVRNFNIFDFTINGTTP